MKFADVEISDPRHVIDTLIAVTNTLPHPDDVTHSEMRAAVSIYEDSITAEERALLFTLASGAEQFGLDIFVTIVALMRYLAGATKTEAIEEMVSRRGTILGLVLEICS